MKTRIRGTPFSEPFPYGEGIPSESGNMDVGLKALDSIVDTEESSFPVLYEEMIVPLTEGWVDWLPISGKWLTFVSTFCILSMNTLSSSW